MAYKNINKLTTGEILRLNILIGLIEVHEATYNDFMEYFKLLNRGGIPEEFYLNDLTEFGYDSFTSFYNDYLKKQSRYAGRLRGRLMGVGMGVMSFQKTMKEPDISNNISNNYEWLMIRYERSTERFIEAESFILELSKMNIIEKLFSSFKILKFLKSRDKYNI
ncbi:MAG: hypothetical protein PHT07_14830 [Paludibacter sp.]|nr:hypothetical protein [Paludibacter sp.]